MSPQFKVWVKPGSEQSFLYGNHVLKSGLGRITENTAQYQGVVVYSMADVPLVSTRHSPCAAQGWAVGKTHSHLPVTLPGLRGGRQVHTGVPEGGSHGHSGVPSG